MDAPIEANVLLADGRHVGVRPIRPEDGQALRGAFARLSPQSRYSRFLHHRVALSDDTLRYLTDVDGHDHFALVATSESLDLKEETGVAVARFVRLEREPRVAEVAVTVLDAWQDCGLGARMLRMLAEAARARGIDVFRAEILTGHRAIPGLIERAHARVVARDRSVTALELDLAALVDDVPFLPFEPGRRPERHVVRS